MKKMTTLLITFVLLFGTVGAASAALPEYGEEWQNAPAIRRPCHLLTFHRRIGRTST